MGRGWEGGKGRGRKVTSGREAREQKHSIPWWD